MSMPRLSFATFFHCAIKPNSRLKQYDIVNILLIGRPSLELSVPIDQPAASNYVNGKKPIAQNILDDVFSCERDEIISRLRKLEFQDIRSVVDALVNLVNADTYLSDTEKEHLTQQTIIPEHEYTFVASVFLSALKCPKEAVSFISKETKLQLQACRTSRPGPGGKVPQTSYEPLDLNSQEDIDKLFDPSRSVSIQRTQVSYPFDLNAIMAHFNLFNEPKQGNMNIDTSNVLHVFSEGTKRFEYHLTTFSGNIEDVTSTISASQFFVNCQEALLYVECASDVPLSQIETVSQSAANQPDPNAPLHCGVSLNENLQRSTCKVSVLTCTPKKLQKIST